MQVLPARPRPKVAWSRPRARVPALTRAPTGASGTARSSAPRRAALTLGVLLRNALGSVSAALVVNWCCSLGNVVSGATPAEQSYAVFLLGTMLWSHVFFTLSATCTQTCLLLTRRFASHPDRPPSYAFALWRLARRAGPMMALSPLLVIGINALVTRYLPSSTRRFKLEFYAGAFANHLDIVALAAAGRHVFLTETVDGQVRMRARHLIASTTTIPIPATRRRHRGRGSVFKGLARAFKLWFMLLPAVFCVIFSSLYVFLASGLQISSQRDMVLVTIGSLLIKLGIQEAARVVLFQRRVRSIRTMFFTVSIPTILIDTQTRLLLQRAQSTNITLLGTILMALTEIVMRFIKAVVTKHQIRRAAVERRAVKKTPKKTKKTKKTRPDAGGALPSSSSSLGRSRVESSNSRSTRTPRRTAPRQADIREMFMAYHSAELYADMSAEYIAFGCSASILYFYWDHPKYRMNASTGSPTSSVRNQWDASQTTIFLVQLLVEVLVDFVSCVLEIHEGIDFDGVREHSLYLALLFASIAILNIKISSVIYIRTDELPP